ncbi:hypothetical protein DPEC_G00312040 [Dallia pectoralis]|uniref:Uncharacterized protein n=1 Tax=Dallia pectoralis TaxID=75939 RepID=A0ACC2FBL2_DALPE|nr:hypothetical protein DPEC_G00312040 [Dallia pectoralis]
MEGEDEEKEEEVVTFSRGNTRLHCQARSIPDGRPLGFGCLPAAVMDANSRGQASEEPGAGVCPHPSDPGVARSGSGRGLEMSV